MASSVGRTFVSVSITVKHGRIRPTSGKVRRFSILNGKEIVKDIERVAYILPIQTKATPEWEVMYSRGKTATRPYNKR